MALNNLGEWLLSQPAFISQLDAVTAETVCSEFGGNFVRSQDFSAGGLNWSYLLLTGSILATSSKGECQSAALRIAQGCLNTPGMGEDKKESAMLILDTLSNHPAMRLALNRGLVEPNFERRLPTAARIEWTRRLFTNSIAISDDVEISVNKFQRAFWSEINNNQWTSISAPTSAGKSFIVSRWIADFVRSHRLATIVYLVPTRALISQVEIDLKSILVSSGIDGISVSSLPLARSMVFGSANVFVFTQERLHLLQTALPSLHVDALVVDEAHKVGDRHRGVLLQGVIERVVFINPSVRIVFASPMTSNPEVLLHDAAAGITTSALQSEDVTVNQNLLWVSQAPRRPKLWDVQLCIDERQIELGQMTLAASPSHESKRLPFVAHALSQNRPGNVIYVNGAADAEKIATQLYDLVGVQDIENSQSIRELSELARKIVHTEFLLAKVLSRGIAFHYGNLPLMIRSEIERLFSIGTIRYLVCTSTLIEGVNTACKNIYLRGPKKGRNSRMTVEDFWNLAGRAGRWGKEFQGNIVCVDAAKTDVWGPDGPPRSRSKYRITRTSDSVLADPQSLIEFIRLRAPNNITQHRPELEHVLSYLVSQTVRYGSLTDSPWAGRFEGPYIARINDALQEALSNLQTPTRVVERNPGISPFAMDELLGYFRTREKPIEELLPVDPASDDAVLAYTRIFGRLSTRFSQRLGPPKRSFVLALLVTRWMRGFPLSRLIEDRLRHLRQGGVVNTATIIRSVMEDVEQIARFEAPRALGCYWDLLQIHLGEQNRTDLIAQVPDFGVLLEFGVAQQTQVSLIGLGASRTTSIALSEIIAADNLTEPEVIGWLNVNDRLWRESDLAALVKREIEMLLTSNTGLVH